VKEESMAEIELEIEIEKSAGEKIRRYKREWEERYSSLLIGRTHWKLAAFAELAIIAGLGFALWNIARKSHTEVVVLEKSGTQINYAGPVQPRDMDDATWDLVRVEQLKKFISAWRTVTSDTQAQNADWDMAFAFVGDNSQARAVLARWYEQHDPLKRAAKGELVTVQFKTFDPPAKGSHTYGIWWTETITNTTGQTSETKTWRARIVYTQKIPSSGYARSVNPLGILAVELAYEPVEE
jgi:type IV secretory pathway TrbF-like protein